MNSEDRVALVGHTETETARRKFIEALARGVPSIGSIVATGAQLAGDIGELQAIEDNAYQEASESIIDFHKRASKMRSTQRRNRNSHGFIHVSGNPELEARLAEQRDVARKSSLAAAQAVDAAETRRDAKRKKRLAHAG